MKNVRVLVEEIPEIDEWVLPLRVTKVLKKGLCMIAGNTTNEDRKNTLLNRPRIDLARAPVEQSTGATLLSPP